jgi:hypothetical protein
VTHQAPNNKTPIPQSESWRLPLAPERSHKDIQAANETARAATQAAILINGGAATAILAYLSKTTPPPAEVMAAAAMSLGGYSFGVASGAASMWCSAQASARFAYSLGVSPV